MPEPISYCPNVAYSVPEEPGPDIETKTRTERNVGSGGSEGRGSAELEGRGGSGQTESRRGAPSCVAPALASVASCGAVLSTQGVAVLVTGATCLASLAALDECLARQRAASK